MALDDETKTEFKTLMDEWANERESKKAEEQAKLDAEKAKEEQTTEPPAKKSFAERVLGL